ncbi:MAG: hypothetical protein R6X34_16290, partial [Chloroflexota bacterium]
LRSVEVRQRRGGHVSMPPRGSKPGWHEFRLCMSRGPDMERPALPCDEMYTADGHVRPHYAVYGLASSLLFLYR